MFHLAVAFGVAFLLGAAVVCSATCALEWERKALIPLLGWAVLSASGYAGALTLASLAWV